MSLETVAREMATRQTLVGCENFIFKHLVARHDSFVKSFENFTLAFSLDVLEVNPRISEPPRSNARIRPFSPFPKHFGRREGV